HGMSPPLLHRTSAPPSDTDRVRFEVRIVTISSVDHDAPDAFASMHELETLVDVFKWHCVGDHRINLGLALHVPVDDPGNVGAPARATKGSPHPLPTRDELERARRDFLTGTRHTDDHRLAPAAM